MAHHADNLPDSPASPMLEVRSADGRPERLVALAAELIAARVDILLVDGDAQAVRAAMQATRTVPIVFLSIGDPVAEGLVQSLDRPGGNVTGLSPQSPELEAKRLDLLVQAVPTTRRVGVDHPSRQSGPGDGLGLLGLTVPATLLLRADHVGRW